MERVWLVSYTAAWILALVHGMALVALLWIVGRIHLRSAAEARVLITEEGPPLNTSMPDFEGRDAQGRAVHSRDYRGGEMALLLLEASCAPCLRLLRALQAKGPPLPFEPSFLVVMEGTPNDVERTLRRYPLPIPTRDYRE